jgi:hypothetical protein
LFAFHLRQRRMQAGEVRQVEKAIPVGLPMKAVPR